MDTKNKEVQLRGGNYLSNIKKISKYKYSVKQSLDANNLADI